MVLPPFCWQSIEAGLAMSAGVGEIQADSTSTPKTRYRLIFICKSLGKLAWGAVKVDLLNMRVLFIRAVYSGRQAVYTEIV